MASSTRFGVEAATSQPQIAATGTFTDELTEAIGRGVKHLLSLQASEGFWLGELEADTTLESDYIFYLHILDKADPQRISKLAILYAHKPDWKFREPVRVDELFRDPTAKATAFAWGDRFFSWRNFFLALDRALKLYERVPWKPLRQHALRQAQRWLLEHLERS